MEVFKKYNNKKRVEKGTSINDSHPSYDCKKGKKSLSTYRINKIVDVLKIKLSLKN